MFIKAKTNTILYFSYCMIFVWPNTKFFQKGSDPIDSCEWSLCSKCPCESFLVFIWVIFYKKSEEYKICGNAINIP